MEEIEALLRSLNLEGAKSPLAPFPKSKLLQELEEGERRRPPDAASEAAAAAWKEGFSAWERAQELPCPLVYDATGLEPPFARSPGEGAGERGAGAAASGEAGSSAHAGSSGGGGGNGSGASDGISGAMGGTAGGSLDDLARIREFLASLPQQRPQGGGGSAAGESEEGAAEEEEDLRRASELLELLVSGRPVGTEE